MRRQISTLFFFGKLFCLAFFIVFSFYSTACAAASSHYDTVQKIYIGYYQRPADPAGLIYWAGRVDGSGGSLTAIIEAFANTDESRALYGTISSSNISTVVNNIYLALFNRDADTGGLNWYVNEYNAGRFTAATIMLNVLYGAQNADLQSINNKLTAANLFTKTIDPELDGSNFQVTYAGEGDAIAGRNFLALNATSVIVPTQDETTAYLRTNIANTGDPINAAGGSANFANTEWRRTLSGGQSESLVFYETTYSNYMGVGSDYHFLAMGGGNYEATGNTAKLTPYGSSSPDTATISGDRLTYHNATYTRVP